MVKLCAALAESFALEDVSVHIGVVATRLQTAEELRAGLPSEQLVAHHRPKIYRSFPDRCCLRQARAFGLWQAQCNYMCRPVPAAELSQWLNTRSASPAFRTWRWLGVVGRGQPWSQRW
ncbi:MAG: hypothetical protein ACYDC9_03690, partial [Dermatophilaceae bacterium]